MKRRPLFRVLLAKARRLLARSADDRWASSGGVVFKRDQVALIRQKKVWTLPKGRVDPGESFPRAARREVREETGLITRVVEYLGVLEGARHDTHWFLMKLERAGGDPDDGEVDEVRFVKIGKARKLLHRRGDRRVLDRALEALHGRPPKDPII